MIDTGNADTGDESYAQLIKEQIIATAAFRELLAEGMDVKEFTGGDAESLEMLRKIVPLVIMGQTLEEIITAYNEMSPEGQAEWLLEMIPQVEDFQSKLEDELSGLEENDEESGEDDGDNNIKFSIDIDALMEMFERLSTQIPGLLNTLPSIIKLMDLDEKKAQQIWDSMKYSPIQRVAKGVDPEAIKALLEALGLFYEPALNDFCNVMSKPLKLSNDIGDHPKMEKERLRAIERRAKETATAYLAFIKCGVPKKDAMDLLFGEKKATWEATREMLLNNMKIIHAMKKEEDTQED